jgi:hypothetical protein
VTYKLFIDDERVPVTTDWVVVRSSKSAIECVQRYGMPKEISFDHDLGGDDTSRLFVNWLADVLSYHTMTFPQGFVFGVHSQNPIGALWINGTMNSLLTHFPPA